MSTRSTLFLLALALALATGVLLWRFGGKAGDDVMPQLPASAPAGPAMSAAPAPVRNPERPQEMVRYPDGSYMPTLNGVTNPAALIWPAERSFSPIVGKQATPDGTEWYIHADGTCSTTMMLWRSDLGRKVPITHVARPVPVLPVDNK